jgi:hypothetical protein
MTDRSVWAPSLEDRKRLQHFATAVLANYGGGGGAAVALAGLVQAVLEDSTARDEDALSPRRKAYAAGYLRAVEDANKAWEALP